MTHRPMIYASEDEEGIREVYELALRREYRIRLFPHGEGLLEALREGHPHLVLTDNDMKAGFTGHDLITRELPQRGYQGKVLMVSGTIPEQALYRTLQKPVRMHSLLHTIQELLQ